MPGVLAGIFPSRPIQQNGLAQDALELDDLKDKFDLFFESFIFAGRQFLINQTGGAVFLARIQQHHLTPI